MYKEYANNHKSNGKLVAGSEADGWTKVWDRQAFDTPEQIASYARTDKWREISKEVQKGWHVLEAGSGMGQWVRFLTDQGLKPVGLDFSQETVSRLKDHFPGFDWRVGDIRDMPLEENSFDMLVSWGVIEHLEEGPQQAVNEFYRVLKPGGYGYITVPWLSPRRQKKGMNHGGSNMHQIPEGQAMFHQYYYDEHELSGFMEKAGFKVLRTCPSAVHAKGLLPKWGRKRFKLFYRAFNRLSPLFPPAMIAHMILIVVQKPLSS